ncbi:hypothetical protein CHS0354_024082 [Potamilus streckersoni]|uniref:Uncharacterized protein n=1 Tax=Potamilus streckersoni TaxID=2493646 RepID=A0AAE0RZC5_9BIVA|nr:hypothetical protein CHS0354_024082 [Potamilus streckersoni]
MTENASLFPNLPVPLTQVVSERDTFRDTFNSSQHAGRTGDLQKSRKVLEESLHKNGMYINELANGDLSILERSGYPLAKEPKPHGPVPATDRAGVSYHSGGGFDIWAVAPEKDYYGVLFAFTEVTNPDNNPLHWFYRYSPIPKTVISNDLIRGKEYKFAVAFVRGSETLNWFKLSETLFAN